MRNETREEEKKRPTDKTMALFLIVQACGAATPATRTGGHYKYVLSHGKKEDTTISGSQHHQLLAAVSANEPWTKQPLIAVVQ